MNTEKSVNQRIAELLIGVPLVFEASDELLDDTVYIFREGIDDLDDVPYDTLKDYSNDLNAVFAVIPFGYETRFQEDEGGISFHIDAPSATFGYNVLDVTDIMQARQEAAVNALEKLLLWKAEQNS